MFEFFHTQFTSNPVFAGMISAGILAGVVYQLRALPGYVWKLFASQFLLRLDVHHDDKAYRELSLWLSKHEDGTKARRVMLASYWNPVAERTETIVTPGAGWLRLREDGRVFYVRREIKEPSPDSGMMGQRQETLRIFTLGRDPEVFKRLATKTSTIFEDPTSIPIFQATGSGGFTMAGRRTKRSLDTIDIPADQKARIIAKLDEFMASRESYNAKAIPWRMGLLLEGIPGSGKTSLICAIASYLNRPVHLINPAIMEKDSNLQDAVANAGSGIVVIEDIDSIPAVLKRKVADDGSVEVSEQAKPGSGLTLSGFLNAFDGVASHEGRILIVTSNHADALDPAMLRPGRIDMRENLGVIAEAEVRSMARRLRPDWAEGAIKAAVKRYVGKSPAWVQNALLGG